MNSIESYSPPKVSAIDGDAKDLSAEPGSDPTALEMLRAMMSGVVQQQPAFSAELKSSGESDDAADKSAGLMALLTKVLRDQSLPESIKKVLASAGTDSATALVQTLAKPGGDPAKSLAQLLAEALADPDAENPKTKPQPNDALLAQALVKALATPDAEPAQIEQKPNESSLGESILRSFGAQSSTAAPEANSAAGGVNQTPTVERVEQVSALMTEMADRVLVTDPVHGQLPEVRVKLAENIMPGTEVRVWRDGTGQLQVTFDTVSPYWARVLNDASAMLAQRLTDRLPLIAPPQVIVQEQGGQPEDGRSRNRQTPWDLARQSAEG